jgi:peptide-methionine (R)-S-oxide reductase
MKRLVFSFLMLCFLACKSQSQTQSETQSQSEGKNTTEVQKTSEQWQTCLTPEQYRVLREKGTERAFTGKFYDHHEEGVYTCAGCGHKLFASTHKFDSGTGWPSYWNPYSQYAIKTNTDKTHGMERVEVVCAKCGGHLGHVFDDGPAPTGMRYCINSASLGFEPTQKNTKKDEKKK